MIKEVSKLFKYRTSIRNLVFLIYCIIILLVLLIFSEIYKVYGWTFLGNPEITKEYISVEKESPLWKFSNTVIGIIISGIITFIMFYKTQRATNERDDNNRIKDKIKEEQKEKNRLTEAKDLLYLSFEKVKECSQLQIDIINRVIQSNKEDTDLHNVERVIGFKPDMIYDIDRKDTLKILIKEGSDYNQRKILFNELYWQLEINEALDREIDLAHTYVLTKHTDILKKLLPLRNQIYEHIHQRILTFKIDSNATNELKALYVKLYQIIMPIRIKEIVTIDEFQTEVVNKILHTLRVEFPKIPRESKIEIHNLVAEFDLGYRNILHNKANDERTYVVWINSFQRTIDIINKIIEVEFQEVVEKFKDKNKFLETIKSEENSI